MRAWLGGLMAAGLFQMSGCVLSEEELQRDADEQMQRFAEDEHGSSERSRELSKADREWETRSNSDLGRSRREPSTMQPSRVEMAQQRAMAQSAAQSGSHVDTMLRANVADAADGSVAGSVRWLFGSVMLLEPFDPAGRRRLTVSPEVPVFRDGDVVNRSELRPGTSVNVFLKRRPGSEPQVLGVLILRPQDEYMLRISPVRDGDEEAESPDAAGAGPSHVTELPSGRPFLTAPAALPSPPPVAPAAPLAPVALPSLPSVVPAAPLVPTAPVVLPRAPVETEALPSPPAAPPTEPAAGTVGEPEAADEPDAASPPPAGSPAAPAPTTTTTNDEPTAPPAPAADQ